jgi:hypothetical protein
MVTRAVIRAAALEPSGGLSAACPPTVIPRAHEESGAEEAEAAKNSRRAGQYLVPDMVPEKATTETMSIMMPIVPTRLSWFRRRGRVRLPRPA